MRDFKAYRASAIRYWERRRVVFNAALILPTVLGYLPAAGVSAGVGDVRQLSDFQLIAAFASAALAANVCYTFAYAAEFLFGSDDPTSKWLSSGRALVFACGVLLSMPLAFMGALGIAFTEYPGGP